MDKNGNINKALALLREEIQVRRRELSVLEETVSKLESQLTPTIKAFPTEPTLKSVPTRPIQWSSSISDLFKVYESLTLSDVLEKLKEGGVINSIDPGKKASACSALSRKVKQGELEKLKTGSYRRKEREDRFLDYQEGPTSTESSRLGKPEEEMPFK